MLKRFRAAFGTFLLLVALTACASYPKAPEQVGPGIAADNLARELVESGPFVLKTFGQGGARDFPVRFQQVDGRLRGFIGSHSTSRHRYEVELQDIVIENNAIIRFSFNRPSEGVFPLEMARHARGDYRGKMSGVSMGYHWSVPADLLKKT
jgi:hypothetical protein